MKSCQIVLPCVFYFDSVVFMQVISCSIMGSLGCVECFVVVLIWGFEMFVFAGHARPTWKEMGHCVLLRYKLIIIIIIIITIIQILSEFF